MSHSRRDTLLKLLGGHFLDKAVMKIKNGSTFRGTGDNWDIRILKGQFRKDVRNEDLHLFATNLIENRVNFQHLPNVSPLHDIKALPRSKFLLNVEEWEKYAESAKILVACIFLEFFPEFSFLKKVIPIHIQHLYSKEMEQKSFIVPMPIINANEAKYGDCVKILRTYENWIAEIYNKTGLLKQIPHCDNPPVPDVPAAAGQTNAHTCHTSDDPMKDMKVVFGGDQLTRVRFAGAKDLLAGKYICMYVCMYMYVSTLSHCMPAN